MKAYPVTYEQAAAYESEAAKLVEFNRLLRRQGPPTEVTLRTHEKLQALVPVGMYRHFKHTPEEPKFYDVLGVEEDVNTGLFYVRYAAQYGTLKGRPALRILVGGKDSFLRPIDRGVYRGPRFMRADDVLELD